MYNQGESIRVPPYYLCWYEFVLINRADQGLDYENICLHKMIHSGHDPPCRCLSAPCQVISAHAVKRMLRIRACTMDSMHSAHHGLTYWAWRAILRMYRARRTLRIHWERQRCHFNWCNLHWLSMYVVSTMLTTLHNVLFVVSSNEYV